MIALVGGGKWGEVEGADAGLEKLEEKIRREDGWKCREGMGKGMRVDVT